MDVRLRTVRESDFDFVDRLGTDPTVTEPFEWFGFRFPETWSRERWAKDRFLEGDLRFLAVAGDAYPELGRRIATAFKAAT